MLIIFTFRFPLLCVSFPNSVMCLKLILCVTYLLFENICLFLRNETLIQSECTSLQILGLFLTLVLLLIFKNLGFVFFQRKIHYKDKVHFFYFFFQTQIQLHDWQRNSFNNWHTTSAAHSWTCSQVPSTGEFWANGSSQHCLKPHWAVQCNFGWHTIR